MTPVTCAASLLPQSVPPRRPIVTLMVLPATATRRMMIARKGAGLYSQAHAQMTPVTSAASLLHLLSAGGGWIKSSASQVRLQLVS